MVDMVEGRAATHVDLDKLKKWADRKLRKFNEDTCKVLHRGQNNLVSQYRLRDN